MNLNLPPVWSINGSSGKLSHHLSATIPYSCLSAAEPIHDLDWSSTPDNQSILAVGFTHHIELLCQQRKTYFDNEPGWVICWKVDIGKYVNPLQSP